MNLIANGDDFGISQSANTAIERAHREGILTSASLMVSAPAFEEAVRIAKKNPALRVGIHLVLFGGKSVLHPSEISGLVDADGNFPENPVLGGFRYFFQKGLLPKIEKELEAQILKFLSAGLALDHINGHMNCHIHPSILPVVLQLAKRYKVSAIRLPYEPLRESLRLERDHFLSKTIQSATLSLVVRAARRNLLREGFDFTDLHFGLLMPGRITENVLLAILSRVGTNGKSAEICFHPGMDEAGWMPGHLPREELLALTSPRIKEKIKNMGIRLTAPGSLC